MPLNGIYGFERDSYPEVRDSYVVNPSDTNCFEFTANPHLDVTRNPHFQKYVDILQTRGDYSLFVPNRNTPFVQQGEDSHSSLLTVFHKSWADMMNLFES